MEYKAFQYVLKIAELGNLTRAANELYVSQPSLSHYIARVEQEVGTPLFQRGVSPMRLTPAGEKYAETARMILALDKRMQQDISDIVNQKTGIIMLGMSHARASFLLPHVMPTFHRKYPGVDIRTTEARSDLLETYLAKGTCDLGVMPLPLSGKNDLESEVLFREELLLVSGKELPHETDSSGREYVDFSVCQDAEFTLLKKGHGIRTALEAIFMEHGIRTGRVFETTSNET
nr:LysR family transcriptional regulator [Clostridium sp.]